MVPRKLKHCAAPWFQRFYRETGTLVLFAALALLSSSCGGEDGSVESPPPKAATMPATNITIDNASLNGTVNPNGLATNAWFEWGIDNTALTGRSPDFPAGTGATDNHVVFVATGLQSRTTYYFRIAAINSAGKETQGEIRSFTTLSLPTVSTEDPTEITTGGAKLNGEVNPNGSETNAWFEYGTDPSLSNPHTTDNQLIGSEPTSLSFQQNISGLAAYSTWYFRVVAQNAGGTQTGVIKSFPTGEKYVAIGDSITQGIGDDIPSDGTGYEPILGELLTGSREIPNTVVNEGVGGDDSADGLLPTRLPSILARHPDANYYLILYGTNDANPLVNTPSGLGQNPAPSGSFKYNLQQMINLISNSNKTPYLAKVPYTQDVARIAKILEYNQVIDELVVANGISAPPPDFYTWFQTQQGELTDPLHPNGAGYQSMAALWRSALIP